jgi:hypothetical protein
MYFKSSSPWLSPVRPRRAAENRESEHRGLVLAEWDPGLRVETAGSIAVVSFS